MAIAPFHQRALVAAGRHLAVAPDQLAGRLGGVVVELRVGEGCAAGNDRWIAELAVNMLARLYPTIALGGPDPVVTELAAVARRINPMIDVATPGQADVRLVLGGVDASPDTLSADVDGWVVRTGWGEPGRSTDVVNPYAAGYAAAVLVNEVFRRVFRLGEGSPARTVSLLDFGDSAGRGEELPEAGLGEFVLAGVGAVGNASVWAWARHGGLQGTLWAVDAEDVELSNLQRYVLCGAEDERKSKVDVALDALRAGPGIRVERRKKELEAFAEDFPDGWTLPALCVAADNATARRTAQGLLPRLVLNGWTSDLGLGASWHRFGQGMPCLACLYQPDGVAPSQTDLVAKALGLAPERAALLWISNGPLEERDLGAIAEHFKVSIDRLAEWSNKPLSEVYTGIVCGNAAVAMSGSAAMEAVPLAQQSVLAGILMASELVKRLVPDLERRAQPHASLACDQVLRGVPGDWRQPRKPHPDCICADPIYQAVYAEKWSSPA
jgi:hypothetical protein